MTYTKNGNIKTLVRTATSSTAVDNLTCTYTGNRLTRVVDAHANTSGSYQLPGTTNYTYDANGNMKTRVNSGSTGNNITAITYNYLNLPQSVMAVAGNVTYTYDGKGRKLRSVNGINGQTRDYINGIEYVGGTMELIHHQEGRITRSGTTYTYHYFLEDHQNNNRVGFSQGTNVTAPNFTADYYPFGLQYRQYVRAGSPKINYLYSGKEFQDGLKLYDFGSRYYDATIGRWGTPDPAQQYVNPYLALGNSPVNGVDPDGEFFEIFGLINLFTNRSAGHVDGFWSGVKAYTAGFLSAMFRPGETLAHGTITKSVAEVNGIANLVMGKVGRAKMSSKLALAPFHFDNNRSLADQVHNAFLRDGQGPQNVLGHGWSQIRITLGYADRVDYFGGATFTTNENNNTQGGVSLGNYINVNIWDNIQGGFKERVLNDPLYMHEYGHTFDSRIFGPGYVFGIGLPSIISAGQSTRENPTHDSFWTERRANRHAARYFQKYYGIDWSEDYDQIYPR